MSLGKGRRNLAVVTSGVGRWYQRTGPWVSISLAALVVAPVLVGVLVVLPLEGFAVFALSLLGLVVSALIPVGLWMGALVARRNWSQGILAASTLLLIFLAAWSVWNFLEATEVEAEEECFLIEASDPEVVGQLDVDLCESLTSGELDALRRWSWAGFFVLWVAPLFVLYFSRRRFEPG